MRSSLAANCPAATVGFLAFCCYCCTNGVSLGIFSQRGILQGRRSICMWSNKRPALARPAGGPTSHAPYPYRVRRPLFNRQHETQQLESFCMHNPTEILVILGPRSCGKTAIIKSCFAGKKNALYIDCRDIDASSPATFVYALIKELLPKVPVSAEQLVIRALSLIPTFALQLAGGLSVTGKMDATPSETINLAGLVKALLDKPIEGQKAPGLNELFAALRCAACPCGLCLHLAWLH